MVAACQPDLFCSSFSSVLTGCIKHFLYKFKTDTNIKPETRLRKSGIRPRFKCQCHPLKLSGAQALVIAVTSWAMLFEEIITDSDNEGKRAWLHPTEHIFFPPSL